MKNYIGTKFIKADEMKYYDYCIKKYGEYKEDSDFKVNNKDKDGYLVEYEGGYISWSPKEVFEKVYFSECNLSFGHAIELMKKGCKVAREGWNGKGMFIYIQEGTIMRKDMARNKILSEIENYIKINPHIDMKSADGSIVVGWLASQTDMLSNDWIIVE